jgi:excinuclease UvrABC ATPase subunit
MRTRKLTTNERFVWGDCPVCDGEGTVDRGPWIDGLCFECLGEKYEEILETSYETKAEARLDYPDAVDMEIIE